MGRRKIPMEMVKDGNTRQVTFSKRRNGVFKKADELSTLCGVDVAVMVFSPGGRPYSYGSPNVNAVVDRYLSPGDSSENPTVPNPNSRRSLRRQTRTQDSQAQLNALEEDIEAERLRGLAIDERLKETREKHKLKDVENLSVRELSELKQKLDSLRETIQGRAAEMEASSTLMMLSRDKTPFISIKQEVPETATENENENEEKKKNNNKNKNKNKKN